MGYYNTRISTVNQDTMTIVTEFGKSRYNRLPTEMCALGDILQAKLDELLSDIEGFKTCIDSIIFLIKEI